MSFDLGLLPRCVLARDELALFLLCSQGWGGWEFCRTSAVRGVLCAQEDMERQRPETKPPQDVLNLQPETFPRGSCPQSALALRAAGVDV